MTKLNQIKLIEINKIADFINGRAFKPEVGELEGLPIIRIQNLTGSSNKFNYFSGYYDPKFLVKKGDILISWSASLGVYKWKQDDGILNQHIFKVICNDLVDKEYFYYAASFALDEMISEVHGATMQHITKDRFESIKIPLPPLEEQKRIAEILSKCDNIRRIRKYSLQVSDTYLQSVFLEMFGDPAINPMGWQFQNLNDISEIASGVTKGQKFNGKKTVIVPYLRVANVQDGYLDLSEIKTIESLEREANLLQLQKGDVVMTEGGDFDKLGRGAIWKGEIENCIHQNHIFRVRTNKNRLTPYFFASFLRTNFTKKYFLRCSKQTTNLATINMTQLKDLPVLLPPLQLQEKFTKIVEKFERLQNQKQEAQRQADHLFQTLLHQAFTGKL